jgi:hypothetical protein
VATSAAVRHAIGTLDLAIVDQGEETGSRSDRDRILPGIGTDDDAGVDDGGLRVVDTPVVAEGGCHRIVIGRRCH